jgi:hypothetical protein
VVTSRDGLESKHTVVVAVHYADQGQGLKSTGRLVATQCCCCCSSSSDSLLPKQQQQHVANQQQQQQHFANQQLSMLLGAVLHEGPRPRRRRRLNHFDLTIELIVRTPWQCISKNKAAGL